MPGGLGLSPASIRSVLHDLEALGLLGSPHTSAARVPTERGLRLFVDGLMQASEAGEEERAAIEASLHAPDRTVEDVLTRAPAAQIGSAACRGIVCHAV